MRRTRLLAAALLSLLARPLAAQGPAAPPHAWLFGAWIGGMFPPPVTVGLQDCLAQPTVIFTRDLVMRAVLTDIRFVQRQVETVRATASGFQFRLVSTPQIAGSDAAFGQGAPPPPLIGFGCGSPNELDVQRRGENEISFPHCTEFPFPLIRCTAR